MGKLPIKNAATKKQTRIFAAKNRSIYQNKNILNKLQNQKAL